MKLRRNWTVEELVAHFTQSRDAILAYAQQPPPQQHDHEFERPKKRRKIEPTTNGAGRRSTRSQSRKIAASASQASPEPTSTQEEVADSEEEGSVYQDEHPRKQSQKPTSAADNDLHDGLVACPSCHRHRCLAGLPTSPEPSITTQAQPATNGTASLAFAQRTKSPTVTAQKDRLPSINYALYTETSLRKKLKELAIPNHGNKELMRKRHTEWMNLWNANCDSSRPKPKRDLLRELDTWERTLGRQIERNTTTSSGVMVKDFDRDGWVKTQKGEFDDLIKQAREKRKAAVMSEKDGAQDTMMADEAPASAQQGAESLKEQAPESTTTATEQADTRVIGEPLPQHSGVEVAPQADEIPTTPQKPRTDPPIDLISSPASAMPGDQSQQTPGRQRSKFFV
ncbi:E3 ubiquitin-protein ligase rad18 [Exophiala xenobiotica]|uniref:E3 ubiquitin-protein ligase rad18 n=1 Tax=Lithohypha guttulata TaxID=1690604 RepID=A0ABR0K6N1_9EURO|nr:E3 ubiquitin-protein ligase rad18 [Lithohypha guttulata]KAK5315613.1 E3 ubiquitin-protein ligase rad18 [Exophiala xenobiotica]